MFLFYDICAWHVIVKREISISKCNNKHVILKDMHHLENRDLQWSTNIWELFVMLRQITNVHWSKYLTEGIVIIICSTIWVETYKHGELFMRARECYMHVYKTSAKLWIVDTSAHTLFNFLSDTMDMWMTIKYDRIYSPSFVRPIV